MEDVLTISVVAGASTVTLQVAGELDRMTAPQLDEAVRSALETIVVDRMVVDVAGVVFVDSAGLSSLLDARSRGDDAGVTTVVANPTEHCQRLLTATNLLEVLT